MWKIKIHLLVIEEDLKKITKKDRSIILKTIHKKLSVSPEEYGSQLLGPLKGYWKLKISHYRFVYKIEKKQIKVLVMKVGMRRDEKVYREMLKRMEE